MENLFIQGHINAIEFFGLKLGAIKQMTIDMMDELALAPVVGNNVSYYHGM